LISGEYLTKTQKAGVNFVQVAGPRHGTTLATGEILVVKRSASGVVESYQSYRYTGIDETAADIKFILADTTTDAHDANDAVFTSAEGLYFFDAAHDSFLFAPQLVNAVLQDNGTIEDRGFHGHARLFLLTASDFSNPSSFQLREANINVKPGFSAFSLSGSVGYKANNTFLDVLRVQQRLKFLGYRTADGYALAINVESRTSRVRWNGIGRTSLRPAHCTRTG
jgi:hypothetical protein